MVSTRRHSAKNWDVLVREFPITSRFVKLTAHRHQLAKLNSLLLVRVWEELGGIVGFNGTLLVGKFSVRLAAGTDFVPISAEVAVLCQMQIRKRHSR